jgi:hypothetical protein
MLTQIITIPQWLMINQETRRRLALEFGMTRSGHMEVIDNKVVSDGFTNKDLEKITLERLQEITKSNNDSLIMQLALAVDILEGKAQPVAMEKIESDKSGIISKEDMMSAIEKVHKVRKNKKHKK